MDRTSKIFGVNGPIVYVNDESDLKMSEMVYVGENKLVGEVMP